MLKNIVKIWKNLIKTIQGFVARHSILIYKKSKALLNNFKKGHIAEELPEEYLKIKNTEITTLHSNRLGSNGENSKSKLTTAVQIYQKLPVVSSLRRSSPKSWTAIL